MRKIFGGIILTLFVEGIISISDVKILTWTFIFCFSSILVIYVYLCYKIVSFLIKLLSGFNGELSFLQRLFIILLIGFFIFLFWILWEKGYIPDICKNISYWMATHVLLPGHGESPQINLE